MTHYREIADARFDAEQSARMAQNFKRMNDDRFRDDLDDAMSAGLRAVGLWTLLFLILVVVGVIATIAFG
jgi:hypothetical protein